MKRLRQGTDSGVGQTTRRDWDLPHPQKETFNGCLSVISPVLRFTRGWDPISWWENRRYVYSF